MLRGTTFEPVRIKFYITGFDASLSAVKKLKDDILPRVQNSVATHLTVNPVTNALALATVTSCSNFVLSDADKTRSFSGVDVVILITS